MHHYRLFTLIALLLVAAGCSSPASTAKGPATVEIRTFQFTPAVLEVARGTTVTWTNRDDILHTATAGTAIKNSGANPNLPKGAVEQLLVMHVNGIAKSVDLLAAKDYKSGYANLKTAEDHSIMLADPITAAIVKQFPDKLGN